MVWNLIRPECGSREDERDPRPADTFQNPSWILSCHRVVPFCQGVLPAGLTTVPVVRQAMAALTRGRFPDGRRRVTRWGRSGISTVVQLLPVHPRLCGKRTAPASGIFHTERDALFQRCSFPTLISPSPGISTFFMPVPGVIRRASRQFSASGNPLDLASRRPGYAVRMEVS